ncbi:hypothetical protein SAMN02949497_1762 [Methylomagnum ishizawai]|uniref:Gp5/Type VI secretion system Vgr protein OB-fold domain-containing protein n=1 Tax=Methylomagnum ishizawai TaxID=1760988 RepID=A0A1Y6CVT1_9GAMM|nr:hypothetical protein [Methylomagnum ishizawai]SMF94447.1 hypothetical protein SAMN02949497_1762 [Methylomagnum ishizawai]
MDDAIRRMVERQFPELSGGLHLPKHAEVVGIREGSASGDIADPYRPRLAVDLQVLDAHGNPDTAIPILRDVPVPIPTGGHERGQFALPEPGTKVEMGFAYGSPDKPMIRAILADGLGLPDLEPGEQRRQHSAESFDRIDAQGNHERRTNGRITDHSVERVIEALEVLEQFTQASRAVDADELHEVGGLYRLRAMGALQALSGGRLDLGAVGDANLSSKGAAKIRAPAVWVGSESENLLELVSLLMGAVKQLCTILAAHTHPSTGPCDQGGDIAGVGGDVDGYKGRVDGIKA